MFIAQTELIFLWILWILADVDCSAHHVCSRSATRLYQNVLKASYSCGYLSYFYNTILDNLCQSSPEWYPGVIYTQTPDCIAMSSVKNITARRHADKPTQLAHDQEI